MHLLRNRLLLSVALGHFAVDLLAAVVPVFVAFASIPLGLSNAQVGLAATLYTVTSSLSQPVFGHLADRYGGRCLAVAGLCWMSLWISLATLVSDYIYLVVCLTIAGLGSAAYHPQGAMNAFLATATQKGGSLSIWSLGGAIGFSMGPGLAGIVFELLGTGGVFLISLAILPVAFVLARNVPRERGPEASLPQDERNASNRGEVGGGRRAVRLSVFAAFLLLVVARSWTYTGITTFTPKLYAERGYMPAQYGALLTAILFALALGNLMGGFLADWIGKRPVISGSLLVAAPAFSLFFLLPSPWNIICGALGGFALGVSQSLTLLIVQQLMPGRLGLASGLIMGFTFASGAIGTSASGFVADRIGLLAVLRWIAVLPLVSALCGIALPRESQAT